MPSSKPLQAKSPAQGPPTRPERTADLRQVPSEGAPSTVCTQQRQTWNGASPSVSSNGQAVPQTVAKHRAEMNHVQHIAVQLVPIDREAEAVIRHRGNNPHLELNISPMKPLLVAIFFVLDKWKLCGEKRGSLYITPPMSTCPALLKGIRWTEKDTDPTLKIIDIYGFLKKPSPFRLCYGIHSTPAQVPRPVPAARGGELAPGVPTPTRVEPRLPMADVDILSLPSLDNSTTLQQPIDMDVLMDTIRSVAENDDPDRTASLKLTTGSVDACQPEKPGLAPSTLDKAIKALDLPKTPGKGRRCRAANKTPRAKPKPKVAKKPTKRTPAARKPRKAIDSKKTSIGNPVSMGQVALCPGWWANSMALGSGQSTYNPLMYSAARALQMQGHRIPPPRTLLDPNGQEVVGGWAVMPALAAHQGVNSQEATMPLIVNGTPQEEYKISAIDRFHSFVGRPGTVSDEEVNRLWQGLVSEDNT